MSLMERHSSWISYTASGSAVFFGLTLNDFGMLIGIMVGIATFIVNWYYKAKESKRRDRRTSDEQRKKDCDCINPECYRASSDTDV